MNKIKCLTNNQLKIIACISMLFDHLGFMVFPKLIIFRILGRLAFPIFAFMIAEGCYYTRNKLKHFLTIFGSIINVGLTPTFIIEPFFYSFSKLSFIRYSFFSVFITVSE